MQALSADLRACVLDQLDFDRSGTTYEAEMRAREMVDALLALALLSRAWTADAQVRLRRTLVVVDSTDMASLGPAGIGPAIETIVTLRDDWSDADFATLFQLMRGAAFQEYIGAWPMGSAGPIYHKARQCESLGRAKRLHLSSAGMNMSIGNAVNSLKFDAWLDDGGTGAWPTDAGLPALRHLDLDAQDFGAADVLDLSSLLGVSGGLRSLRLWGMMLSELPIALRSAIPPLLRRLDLGLLSDAQYTLGGAHDAARALAQLLAPQVTALCMGSCGAMATNSAHSARHRDQLLALGSAWIDAMPEPMAVTIELRIARALMRNPDGVDDGAFATIVSRFQTAGARCGIEISALSFRLTTLTCHSRLVAAYPGVDRQRRWRDRDVATAGNRSAGSSGLSVNASCHICTSTERDKRQLNGR